MRDKLIVDITNNGGIGSIESFEEIDEGLNSIYRIKASKGDFIVKERTNQRNDIEWFRAEPLIYQELHKLSIPSPRVVFSKPQPGQGNPFFVMEKLDGVNPEGFKKEIDYKVLKSIIKEIGRILGLIHSNTGFEDYGMLGGFQGELDNVYSNEKWSSSIIEDLDELEDLITKGWDNPPEINFPENREIREKLPERPESVLLHLDNRLDNLLVDGEKVTAFLDWSHPEAGHHEYDIVRAEYLLIDYDLDFLSKERRDRLREILYGSYETEKSIDREGFNQRRQLYRKLTVIWIIAGFPNWGSRFDEETRKEFREDLIKRIRDVGL